MNEFYEALADRLRRRLGTEVAITEKIPPGTEVLTRADIEAYDARRDAERKAAKEADTRSQTTDSNS